MPQGLWGVGGAAVAEAASAARHGAVAVVQRQIRLLPVLATRAGGGGGRSLLDAVCTLLPVRCCRLHHGRNMPAFG